MHQGCEVKEHKNTAEISFYMGKCYSISKDILLLNQLAITKHLIIWASVILCLNVIFFVCVQLPSCNNA